MHACVCVRVCVYMCVCVDSTGMSCCTGCGNTGNRSQLDRRTQPGFSQREPFSAKRDLGVLEMEVDRPRRVAARGARLGNEALRHHVRRVENFMVQTTCHYASLEFSSFQSAYWVGVFPIRGRNPSAKDLFCWDLKHMHALWKGGGVRWDRSCGGGGVRVGVQRLEMGGRHGQAFGN